MLSRILTVSLRPGNQLLSTSLQLIRSDAGELFTLLTGTRFRRSMLNSLLVSGVVTATGVALASTAEYALSRYQFAGRGSMLKGLLVTQMFQGSMTTQ